jgi:hypothetical protein
MAQFDKVMTALADNRSVRLSKWESNTNMYVNNGVLVQQRGNGAPYSYDLSWREIAAKDWHVIEAATEV